MQNDGTVAIVDAASKVLAVKGTPQQQYAIGQLLPNQQLAQVTEAAAAIWGFQHWPAVALMVCAAR